jgi:hypothetical protein
MQLYSLQAHTLRNHKATPALTHQTTAALIATQRSDLSVEFRKLSNDVGTAGAEEEEEV